jgi:hypothetical protein
MDDPAISVYPNPNAGMVTVEYYANTSASVRFEVCDIAGRVLKTIQLNQSLNQMQVDLSEFANGTYLYKFISDGELVETGTLIISK